jgi:hypothetical protein
MKSTFYEHQQTFAGVFVHCTVEQGKLILDSILSITLLEDLQLKAPLIFEEEPIITYPDASDISTSPAKVELLQLTVPEISSNKEVEHGPQGCQNKKENLDCRTWAMEGEVIPQCQAIQGKDQNVARQANQDQAIQAGS